MAKRTNELMLEDILKSFNENNQERIKVINDELVKLEEIEEKDTSVLENIKQLHLKLKAIPSEKLTLVVYNDKFKEPNPEPKDERTGKIKQEITKFRQSVMIETESGYPIFNAITDYNSSSEMISRQAASREKASYMIICQFAVFGLYDVYMSTLSKLEMQKQIKSTKKAKEEAISKLSIVKD